MLPFLCGVGLLETFAELLHLMQDVADVLLVTTF